MPAPAITLCQPNWQTYEQTNTRHSPEHQLHTRRILAHRSNQNQAAAHPASKDCTQSNQDLYK
jgi:hypothetical protein